MGEKKIIVKNIARNGEFFVFYDRVRQTSVQFKYYCCKQLKEQGSLMESFGFNKKQVKRHPSI